MTTASAGHRFQTTAQGPNLNISSNAPGAFGRLSLPTLASMLADRMTLETDDHS